jgi:putative acetyltransferase
VLIRPEQDGDQAAIAAVNRAAFPTEEEARLVDLIRSEELVIASLVAVDDDGLVVGHILFSPVTVVTAAKEMIVASLAPMAVLPTRQRAGIGSMLVRQGLKACEERGYKAVIVVGHPTYYPRFGFSHELVRGLENPFATGKAFMGLELADGTLEGRIGRVVYPNVFRPSSG